MTENQKLLIQLFKELQMETDTIIGTMLMIQSEEEVEAMMKFIAQNSANLNKEIIVRKAMEINRED